MSVIRLSFPGCGVFFFFILFLIAIETCVNPQMLWTAKFSVTLCNLFLYIPYSF